MATRRLHRFAVNRQANTRTEFPHVLLGPFWTDPQTEFQNALTSADSWPDRTDVAAAHLRSVLYVGSRLRSWRPVGRALAALPSLVAMASFGDETGVRDALTDLMTGGLEGDAESISKRPPKYGTPRLCVGPGASVCDRMALCGLG
jgi:hypothetical protein